MKVKLPFTCLNGARVQAEVSLYCSRPPSLRNSPPAPGQSGLPPQAEGEIRSLCESLFHLVLKDEAQTPSLHFHILSEALKQAERHHIHPEPRALAAASVACAFETLFLAEGMPILPDHGDWVFQEATETNKDKLQEVFLAPLTTLMTRNRTQPASEFVSMEGQQDALLALFNQKTYDKAGSLIRGLLAKSVDAQTKAVWYPWELRWMRLSRTFSPSDMRAKYDLLLVSAEFDTAVVRDLILEYALYLIDLRDYRQAGTVLSELKRKYPEDEWLPPQKALLDFAEGRQQYFAGEYIGSLKKLEQAFQRAHSSELAVKISTLLTAANCFSDNLFFHPARKLGDQALSHCDAAGLGIRYEVLGALGGSAFRQREFAQARSLFRMAKEHLLAHEPTRPERNRIENYLAKTSVALDSWTEAEQHLAAAEQHADTPIDLSFTMAIRSWMFYRQGEDEKLLKLYYQIASSPENLQTYDNFCLGWIFFYQAMGAFHRKKSSDGVRHLVKAIRFFKKDAYAMEAAIAGFHSLLFELPPADQAYLEKMEPIPSLLSDWFKWAKRHETLPKDSFSELTQCGDDVPQSPMQEWMRELAAFFQLSAKDSDVEASRKQLAKLLNRFCLM